MTFRWLVKSKLLVSVSLVLALAIAAACGSDATSTPTTGPTATTGPTDTPAVTATPEPIDLGLLVSPDPNPKYGGTFQTGGRSGVSLFDIHQCSTGACVLPMAAMYDNLVRFDPFQVGMSSVIPDLAKSWEVSDDALEYTFSLRDAKWHDGTNFSADDIVATYQRIVFPPEYVISIRSALFEAVSKIEKIDSKTVKFTLREPRGLFLSSLALTWNVIYQKAQLDAENQDLKAVKAPIGTGPFKFIDYKVGENWDQERNDDYWNPELPYLDAIVTQELGGGTPTGTVFLAGHLDFAADLGGPDVVDQVNAMEDAVFTSFKHPNFTGFWFNTDHAPWGDARMRRAVHWAISKPTLRASIAHVSINPGEGWLTDADPRSFDYWNKGTPLGDGTPTKERIGWREPTAEDKTMALKLMADVLGPGEGLKDVRLVDRGTTTWSQTSSPVLQALLKQEMNIDSSLTTHPRSVVYEQFAKGEFDLGIQATSMTLSLLEDYWGLVFWSKGPQNWGKWSDDEFDKIYIDILRADAGPEKNDLINQGMEILDQEVPMFIWTGAIRTQAWRSWFKGHRRGLARTLYGPWRWGTAWLDK